MRLSKEREIEFQPGDWVIYHKTKWSADPGPRAKNVTPASGGDQYVYNVDKFWVVEEIKDDGSVVLVTRKGKRHILDGELPTLKRASWLERLLHRSRFEAVEEMNRDLLAVETT